MTCPTAEPAGGPGPWAEQLAAALVVHSVLPESCIKALDDVFGGVSELWIVLANGGPGELECIPVISDSEPVRAPLLPEWQVPPGLPSLSRQVMDSRDVVVLHVGEDEDSSPMPSYSDVEELRQRGGCRWVQAAAMCCAPAAPAGLLGAVLLGGRGDASPIDRQWLEEWGGEMSRGIAHASVLVMETSLDMLRRVFPLPVVEQLVSGAVRVRSPSHLLDVAAGIADARLGAGSSSGGRGSGDSSGPAPELSGALSYPGRDLSLRSELSSASSAIAVQTPFATPAAQRPLTSASSARLTAVSDAPSSDDARSVRSGPPASGGATGAPLSPSNGVASAPNLQDAALQVARLGSAASARLSRAGTASPLAVLRAASLESDASLLFSDAQADSPHNSELLGYEDLLEEDRAEHARRMPSSSIDRAQSRGEGAHGGGAADARGSGRQPPGVAGPLPPRGGAAAAAPASAHGAVAFAMRGQAPLASIAEGSSGSVASSLGGLIGGRASGAGSLETLAANLAADALIAVHRSQSGTSVMTNGSRDLGRLSSLESEGTLGHSGGGGGTSSGSLRIASSGSAGTSGSLRGPLLATRLGLGSEPPGPPASMHVARVPTVLARSRQLWHLTFADGDLEHAYQAWSSALSLRADALSGLFFALVLANVLETLASGGTLLTIPGAALALALGACSLPAAGSYICPQAWTTVRLRALGTIRLVTCMCTLAIMLSTANAKMGPWLGFLARLAPLVSMLMSDACYPFPLVINVPFQLACCWMSYMLLTVTSPSNASWFVAVLLGTGFALSNLLVWSRERRARLRFLYSSVRVEAYAADSLEEDRRRSVVGVASKSDRAPGAGGSEAVPSAPGRVESEGASAACTSPPALDRPATDPTTSVTPADAGGSTGACAPKADEDAPLLDTFIVQTSPDTN